MKKTLLVILTALLLFATACSNGFDPSFDLPEVVEPGILIPEGFPTDDNYHWDTDSEPNPSDSVYCAVLGKYLQFEGFFLMCMDPDMLESTSMPLCAREGCRHNQEIEEEKRAECFAWFPGGGPNRIQYYNGRIYVSHRALDSDDYVLSSISPDGTDRRIEKQIASSNPYEPEFLELGHAGFTVLHRGQVFCTWMRPVSETGTVSELWTWTLGETDAEPRCIFRSSNISLWQTAANLRVYGTKLYLYEEYNNPRTRGDMREFDIRGAVYVLDLQTGEISEIKMPEGYFAVGHEIEGGNLKVTCMTLDFKEKYLKAKEEEAAGKTAEFPPYEYFDFLFDDNDANPVLVE